MPEETLEDLLFCLEDLNIRRVRIVRGTLFEKVCGKKERIGVGLYHNGNLAFLHLSEVVDPTLTCELEDPLATEDLATLLFICREMERWVNQHGLRALKQDWLKETNPLTLLAPMAYSE